MTGRFRLLATCCVALGLQAHAAPAARPTPTRTPVGERVVDLETPGGHTQRMLYLSPGDPHATVVMLPGGTGEVGIGRDGSIEHDDNFVIRSRLLWTAKGYAVLIPDAVDASNLRGARSGRAYGSLVWQMMRTAFRLAPVPVVLLGTSQGTIAATSGAAMAARNAGSTYPGALVLTETVSKPGRLSTETVFDADPALVRLPTLIVANQDDNCRVAPPQAAETIAAAFSSAPKVDVVRIRGGIQRSDSACGSRSPHGYYGIEDQVVDLMDRWLAALPLPGGKR